MIRFLRQYAAFCCALVVLTLSASSPYAQDTEEYELKAAYIYNFTKFTVWPGQYALASRQNVDICIIGDSDIIEKKKIFTAASTPNLSFSLVEENNPKNIASHCHVVFIAESEASSLNDILSALKGKPILTVSDIDNFVERGGMIGFVMADKKIKLAINTRPAVSSGLRIDAQLLEIAHRVIDR